MNLVTQLAKDLALVGGFVSDVALDGKARIAVEVATRWIAYAADNINKLIEDGVKLEDLVVKDPDQRIAEYLGKK